MSLLPTYFFRAFAVVLMLLTSGQANEAKTNETKLKVYLLGTGGPEFTPNRLGYATLVEANGQKLLFDTGRGVTQRLYESRVNPKEVTQIFFTHLHSDHIDGLPTLWMTPWFLLGRQQPLEVWGPAGTTEMVQGMRAMFGHDLKHRVNEFNPPGGLNVAVHEIRDGVVYQRDGVRVTAFIVQHGDGNPAFGYRIDYAGHAVVLSGDTTYNDNVVRQGQGADLIVHNVIAFSDRLTRLPEMQGVLAKLTTPQQAAEVFVKAHPRLAVFSHIVTKELPTGEEGDKIILERTRKAGYNGPLQMGQDRMVIEIGNQVVVVPPQPTEHLPALDSKDSTF
ncbi:MBL fold metallo-hydrolase [Deinococcus aluminii]|uniref:Ribonuclease BN n=1 Tax=Deinococcus aluminii TaxID=1656885 RepID=A0ABP9XFZ0_9DEIO